MCVRKTDQYTTTGNPHQLPLLTNCYRSKHECVTNKYQRGLTPEEIHLIQETEEKM